MYMLMCNFGWVLCCVNENHGTNCSFFDAFIFISSGVAKRSPGVGDRTQTFGVSLSRTSLCLNSFSEVTGFIPAFLTGPFLVSTMNKEMFLLYPSDVPRVQFYTTALQGMKGTSV